MTKNPPHAGEMHPDGDELLYLVEGAIDFVLDEEAGERCLSLQPFQAFVVPCGVWHRVIVKQPCRRWPAGREACAEEIASGEMPAGSVLVWIGGTLQGGANRSDQWRYVVFLSYWLGWLRQEENQYLEVPSELARTLPRELRKLVGYKMHQGLGVADPGA
jgi:hypothetical protein